MDEKRERVRRISISLPEKLYQQFEKLVDRRGFRSRSQAIASLISDTLSTPEDLGDQNVSATLTLTYDPTSDTIRREISQLELQHATAICSSLKRISANDQIIEVILLHGSTSDLSTIANDFLTLKGIAHSRLSVIPR